MIKPLYAFLETIRKEDPKAYEAFGKETLTKWYKDEVNSQRLQNELCKLFRVAIELPEVHFTSTSLTLTEFVNGEIMPLLQKLCTDHNITDLYVDEDLAIGLKFSHDFVPSKELEFYGKVYKCGTLKDVNVWSARDVVTHSWVLLRRKDYVRKVKITWGIENAER